METIMEVPEISFETAQKIIQQQLVLILHAHGCQQRDLIEDYENENSENSDSDDDSDIQKSLKKCTLPFCNKTKHILDHIRGCYEPEMCNFSHCHATREIIRHWKTCLTKSNCTICRPIFKAQMKTLTS